MISFDCFFLLVVFSPVRYFFRLSFAFCGHYSYWLLKEKAVNNATKILFANEIKCNAFGMHVKEVVNEILRSNNLKPQNLVSANQLWLCHHTFWCGVCIVWCCIMLASKIRLNE